MSLEEEDGSSAEISWDLPGVAVIEPGDELEISYTRDSSDLPYFRHRALRVARAGELIAYVTDGPLYLAHFEETTGLSADYGATLCTTPGDFCNEVVKEVVFSNDLESQALLLGESRSVGDRYITFISGFVLGDPGGCDGESTHAFAITSL